MTYYFAYGSNMNPRRMAQRGLNVIHAQSGKLNNMALAFNKQSRRNAEWACANVVWSPGSVVEGVLYQLRDTREIFKMDPFEGAPRYYSRERFPVEVECGDIFGWVYIANPAVISNDVLPLNWYLGQLLEGRDFLSEHYVRSLEEVVCHSDNNQGWG